MKFHSVLPLSVVLSIGMAGAQGLYVGKEVEESLPIKWSAGVSAIWDDNVAASENAEAAYSINPYIGAIYALNNPQTTIDLSARVGFINYFDKPTIVEDELSGNGRIGLDITHNISSRTRWVSRNYVSQELEPQYAYGLSSARASAAPSVYVTSDQSIGYKFTERFGTYTGIGYTSLMTDGGASDRDSYSFYQTGRYQLDQTRTATTEYRYVAWTGGEGSGDSTNHYITGGLEWRFNPLSILISKVGLQLRDVDGGESSSAPYIESAINTSVNSRFNIRGFVRYSLEDYGNFINGVDYGKQSVFRLGGSSEYELTPRFSVIDGIDLIVNGFDEGKATGTAKVKNGSSELTANAYVGTRVKIQDSLSTDFTVNYTDAVSDFAKRGYDRWRVSVGINYTF